MDKSHSPDTKDIHLSKLNFVAIVTEESVKLRDCLPKTFLTSGSEIGCGLKYFPSS
jgi:hypothetical protein